MNSESIDLSFCVNIAKIINTKVFFHSYDQIKTKPVLIERKHVDRKIKGKIWW